MERDKQDIAKKRYLAKQCKNHARGETAKNQRSKNWNEDKSRNWVKKVTKKNNSSYRNKIKNDPEYVNSKNRKKLNHRIDFGEVRTIEKNDGVIFHHTDQIYDNWKENRLRLYYGFFKQDFPEKIEKLELLDDCNYINDSIDNAWKEIKNNTRIYEYSIMRINEKYLFINNEIEIVPVYWCTNKIFLNIYNLHKTKIQ